MDNQHRKIKGYRELNQKELDLMNEIKTKGQELEDLCRRVREHVDAQFNAAVKVESDAEVDRLGDAEPHRWSSIGRTDFQTGLMALTRAVAQPTFF